jgi:hypothetical protein
MTDADLDAYRRGFPRGPGQIAGEWTPRYAYDFWTPPLLRRAAPDARLLFLMRDPVARLQSGIEHQSQLTPPRDASQLAQICVDAAARSRYAQQLRRLFDHFPREQVLVLQYERCVADPRTELRRTYRHLGIDEMFQPSDFDSRRGETGARSRRALPEDALRALALELEEDAAGLATLVQDFDAALWPTFSAA